jgi:hypothetical protein
VAPARTATRRRRVDNMVMSPVERAISGSG